MMPDSIQLRVHERSKSSDTEGISHGSGPQRQSKRLHDEAERRRQAMAQRQHREAGRSVESRERGRLRSPKISSFLSCLFDRRVLFYDLIFPATEHSTDFFEQRNQRGEFFHI